MVFTADQPAKKIKENQRVPLMLAISIWERSAQICFFASKIVTCDMVSFGVAFQSDSVTDGRVSES